MDEREYTLVEHLADLRDRVFRSVIGVIGVSLIAFIFAEELVELLRVPLDEAVAGVPGATAKLVAIAPAEYFIAKLKAALVAGVFLSSPWTLYQVWLFVAPGLYEGERRWVSAFVVGGAFCFCAGGLFAYQLVFPGMFRFFIQDAQATDIELTFSVAEHFSFSLKLLLAFGLVFQAPILVLILSLTGIVEPDDLVKYRSYVIVVGFLVGAVLTPPDILSQCLLAFPLVVLFEAGIIIARFVLRMRGKNNDTTKPADDQQATASKSPDPQSSASDSKEEKQEGDDAPVED